MATRPQRSTKLAVATLPSPTTISLGVARKTSRNLRIKILSQAGLVNIDPQFVVRFVDSLPDTYKKMFAWPAISDHAQISARRVPGRASVGTCVAPRMPGSALCVIADDRPGLLATISAALASERLDVIAAEAFTRNIDDKRREAVDVFWVQHLEGGDPNRRLSVEDLAHFENALNGMLDAQTDTRPAPSLPASLPDRPSAMETVVRFLEDKEGRLSTLEVETDDRAGMLSVLARALYEQRVQIVSSHVRSYQGRIRDRFTITEVDDAPIGRDRRLAIQVSVMTAVQSVLQR